MANHQTDIQDLPASEQNFVEILSEAVKTLKYPSESDERIRVIDWQADNPEPFDVLLLKKYLGLTPKDAIMQRKWEDFFEPVTKVKEWYGDDEKARVEKFVKLRELIVSNLEHLQYFRSGQTEIEAYLIGKDKEGKWKGLKTLIVET
jgi:hypothetical protein